MILFRVVIKNERYDNWRKVLMKMKQLFINYEKKVLRVEERELNPSIPKAYNSSAAQGNYLEVLNMSLNCMCADSIVLLSPLANLLLEQVLFYVIVCEIFFWELPTSCDE